jgi:transposase
MMGIKDRSFAVLPHNISLEELVPKENFYRRLQSTLDLSFVRDLVRPLYAGAGRPSVDPVVFFKLQLVMFFEDLRSERKLMSVVADRLSLRWYLGYDLGEPLPDHSSLTRIRERYGLSVFRRFFERIVEMCVEAGLVWGEELYFDATKVEANASLDSRRSRSLFENLSKRRKEHLEEIFSEQRSFIQDAHATGIAAMVGPTAEKRRALAQKNARQHRWIAQAGRQQREIVRWGYKRMADLRVSTTDSDASPMQAKNKSTSRLGYQTHYVVDGGKARVILDVLVTPAEVTENLPMLDLLFRSCFRWRLHPHSVTADAAYGTTENIAAIEKAGIRAYTALVDHEKRTSLFGRDAFSYDAEKDLYTCPKGELLHRRGYDYRERSVRYAARPSACKACSLKARCTKSAKGRWIRRSFDEEYLERVRTYRNTESYRKAISKRAVWVEPLFGEAKDWHGLRRFRLRRLEKVNAEALLIASGQNIKRLLAFGYRGPRRSAQVAALRQPVTNPYKFRGVLRHRKRYSRRSARVFQQPEVFCELRQGGVLRSSHPASCIYRLVEVPESPSKSLRPRWWVLHILVLNRFAESWMLHSKSLPELCTRNLLSQAHFWLWLD